MLKNKNYLQIMVWIIVAGLVMVRASSIFVSAGNFMKTLEPIYMHPFATTDEKMSMKYPRYYQLMLDINRQTPQDSTIYLPVVTLDYGVPMWALGQIQMTQTLLYPRTVKVYIGVEKDGYLVYFTDSDQGIRKL